MEIMASAVISIVQNSVLETILTVETIDAIIKQEFNIVDNISVKTIPLTADSEQLVSQSVEDTQLSEYYVNIIRSSVLKLTPDRLKAAMLYLYHTGEVNYNNYSNQDKQLFNLLAAQAGYVVEEDIQLDEVGQLRTLTERVVFIHYIFEKAPDLFIMMTSMNSISAVLTMIKLVDSKKFTSYGKAINTIQDAARFALKVGSEHTLSKEEVAMYTSMLEEMDMSVDLDNSVPAILGKARE